MSTIIDRVFVYDDRVVALALYSDFGVIMDVPESAPNEVRTAVSQPTKKAQPSTSTVVPRTGATGVGPSLGTSSSTYIWSPHNRVYHLVIRELLKGVQE